MPKQSTAPNLSASVVHLVDDDAQLLETLGLIFEHLKVSHKKYDNVESFLNNYSTSELQQMPGCLVCDIRMPGIGGLECQRILNKYECSLPIIFISGFADVQMVVEAMHEGAFDFIEKPFREQQLLEIVRKAQAHNQHLLAARKAKAESKASLMSLSPREMTVMELLLDGLQNKQIAATLNISLRTVEVHRAAIMDKMAAKNIAQLVKMVLTSQSSG